VLVLVVAGGTLLVGVAGALASHDARIAFKTLHATAAGMTFSAAFAVVVAPIAFAALGARSRIGGYFFLLGVVVLPELFASLLSGLLPASITELVSIPSALAAIKGALVPGTTDVLRLARAVAAVLVFAAIAIMFVRRDVLVLEHREPET
jgi:hypothetical protein